MHAEEKRGLKKHDIGWVSMSCIFVGSSPLAKLLTLCLLLGNFVFVCFQHALQSFCNLCTCHSCRVVNECKVYEKEGAVTAPAASKMEREAAAEQ